MMGEDDMCVRSPYFVHFAARESKGREAKCGCPIKIQGILMVCAGLSVTGQPRMHPADFVYSMTSTARGYLLMYSQPSFLMRMGFS